MEKQERSNDNEMDETKIEETLIQYGVNIKEVGKEEGKKLFKEIIEISQPTISSFSLDESFE